MAASGSTAAERIRNRAWPLRGRPSDYDPLMDLVGDARFVLIGDGTHGTDDFYRERAAITRRLIEEKGFRAVAVEADWPDAYRANRYAQGVGGARDADDALGEFKRFPNWMWRNTVVVEFIEWLAAYNRRLGRGEPPAGFYGLDLYSLFSSAEAVVQYLAKIDPEAARLARYRYSCFDHVSYDPQLYGLATRRGMMESCKEEVVAQLVELQAQAAAYLRRDGQVAEDELFAAEQNARVARNAEAYYRTMYRGGPHSWNLRDRHMFQTLQALVDHLGRWSTPARAVLWEHNSHLGDARATELGHRGELNVGQLVRESYGREALLIGFTTYAGTVTAASDWDEPAECKRVRPGLPESYEALFHRVGLPCFILDLHHDAVLPDLVAPRLERAIGVIYRPETERMSHCFSCQITNQFDAVVHLNETQALEPLDRTPLWEAGEPPETYPTAL